MNSVLLGFIIVLATSSAVANSVSGRPIEAIKKKSAEDQSKQPQLYSAFRMAVAQKK